MIVVPPPRATVLSAVSPPDAERVEKTAANPIIAVKNKKPTSHRLASFNLASMFFSPRSSVNSR